MIKKICFIILSVILFVLSAPLNEQIQAEEVEPPKTGFEKCNDGSWTTHQEELDFLEELAEKSDRMEYEVYGYSAEGLPMHLVKVGYPNPGTNEEIAEGRNIFIMGTMHGNEPSGREMALSKMRDLAFTEDPEMLELLQKSTILFLPTANPDGREANRRRVQDDIDPNRDAVFLMTPEHRVIARIQNEFQPDIVMDAHERISGPNISVLGNLNLNVDKRLQELNDDLIENYIFPDLEEGNITYEYYPPSGNPGTIRGMTGLRHSIGILTEGAWNDEPLVRYAGQMQSVESILRFYSERFDEVGEVVAASRANKKKAGGEQSELFYLEGMVGELPKDEAAILDPPPCGYLINERQKEKISTQIDLFSLEIEEVSEGYFITMDQPMMTVIPFILHENSRYKIVNGLAVYDCSELDSLDPPSLPEPKQYKTDFTEYEAGELADDWTEYWGNSDWIIQDNPKRLEHSISEGEGKRVLTWDKVEEVDGDVEIAALVRADSEGKLFQLYLHAHSIEGNEYGYYLDITKSHNESMIGINRLHSGDVTELNSEVLPFDIEVDTWYQIVLHREGDALKGKVWPYTEEEPEEWQVVAEDRYVTLGNVGIGHDTAGVINDWKYFSVGTYGEEAERAPSDIMEGLDRSALDRRINQIKDENLDEAIYSAESWGRFTQTLQEAERILEETNVTQKEIDEAVKNLYQAYMSLAAHYQTDFSEHEVGKMPSDWSTLWRESGWTVKDKPNRLEHFLAEGSGRRVLTWDKPGDIMGDVEISALVKKGNFEPGVFFQLHLQAYGDAGSESSYYLDVNNSGSVRINRNRNGGFTSLKSARLPFSLQFETWYQAVFKREGTMLKGKVWPYGTEEPEGWQVEVEDSSHFRGKVGVGHVTTGVTNDWAFFGVGTNDQEAPRAPEDLIVETTPLELKIEELESLDEALFSQDSWTNLQKVMDEARGLLNKPGVTQAEIYEAVEKLGAAYSQLQSADNLFTTEFSEYDTGTAPSDWSTLWRESGWEIKGYPNRLEHFVTPGGFRRGLTWDKAGEVYGDVEVSTLVKKAQNDIGVFFQVHMLASGEAGTESSYYLDVTNAGSIRINRNLNGGFTVLGTARLPFSAEIDTWYQAVFKREGTKLKGKVWPYGEAEPDNWHIEVEDDSFTKGKVGVGQVSSGAINEWSFYSVGIGDMKAERAPHPTAEKLIDLVEHFGETGEYGKANMTSLFTAHLAPVSQFERKNLVERVISHMQKFLALLDEHKQSSLITEQAYEDLYHYSELIIKHWE